ncbi:hypothetical protein [Candidatus Nanohalococcus occultus]|uniref:hypothetical protein n=1 Tax=Candidatus Nanohalococcus occultus TaxID=2978047 RepID=UPI0039E01638
MNITNSKIVLALMIIVAASGCTDPENGSSDVQISQTEGLVIDEFAAFPADVPEKTQVQIDLVMVNKGEREATNVDWSIENIPFEGSRTWSKEGGFEQQNLRVAAGNPETGQQAGRRSIHPTISAPDLSQGLSIPYTMNANVTYDYSTIGVTDVTLMSRSQYQETGTSKSSVSLDNSGGPIQLETDTRNPIVYYSTGGSTSVQNSRFCVTAENAGTGNIVGDSVDVSVETSGTLEVSEQRDGDYGTAASAPIQFIGGRSSSQNCFYIKAPGSVSGQLTLPITVRADYRYQMMDSTTVTVNGRGEGGLNAPDSGDDSSSWTWNYDSWADEREQAQIDAFWNTASGTGGVAELVSEGYLSESDAEDRNAETICSAYNEAEQDDADVETSFYDELGCQED